MLSMYLMLYPLSVFSVIYTLSNVIHYTLSYILLYKGHNVKFWPEITIDTLIVLFQNDCAIMWFHVMYIRD